MPAVLTSAVAKRKIRSDSSLQTQAHTVATIARRHGFHHLSPFTATFRDVYGILPSQMLRRGRRSRVE
jgi:AraC-like DNA-binding protein